jgi:amino acid efflux transporter
VNKKLGRWQAVALSLSFVVGSGVLILPVLSLQLAGPVPSLYAWSLMVLIALPLVLIFYKMSMKRTFTLSGCFTDTFGETATRGAQMTVLSALVFGMPAMIYTTASLLIHIFQIKVIGPGLLSHLILTALCLNHLRPLHKSSKVSLYSAILLLLLIAASVSSHPRALGVGLHLAIQTYPRWDHTFFQACTLTFFGFVGWESLSFFSDELESPEQDLKWVYGVSFALVSLFYLALSATISGLASQGYAFGIQEGFLSMLPAGSARLFSSILATAILLTNLNAWVFAGVKQMRQVRGGPDSSKRPLFYYYIAISSNLLLLDLKCMTLPSLFLLTNQNWIVIYGGILTYYFMHFKSRTDRVTGAAGVIGFLLLLTGCSALILFNVALFGLGRLLSIRNRYAASPALNAPLGSAALTRALGRYSSD